MGDVLPEYLSKWTTEKVQKGNSLSMIFKQCLVCRDSSHYIFIGKHENM